MTLLTAVNNVKKYGHKGDQTITTDDITSDIIGCIMDARRDIISRIPKKWLKKPAASPISTKKNLRPAVYSLASDVQDPIEFWYVEGTTIYHLQRALSDQEWFGRIYNFATAPNRPLWFREIGLDGSGNKQIELFPIELLDDDVRKINYEYYKTVPTDMTVSNLNTEIPDVPGQLHNALWMGGLYFYMKAFDDPGQGVAKADYEAAMMNIDINDQNDADAQIALKWGVENLEPRGQNGIRIF